MIAVANNNFAAERESVRAQLLAHGECPFAFQAVWNDFEALSAARGRSGMNGSPMPISFEAIGAYAGLSGVSMAPWHVALIRDLDQVHQRAMAGALEPLEG